MVKRFLFQTRLGDWLLSLVERLFGLAVVSLEDLTGEARR
jgi:hypothetical protein